MVTVYTCVRCGREVARGPAAPAGPCPFCGFAGDPGRIVVHMKLDGRGRWPARLRPAFLYTVAIEGALLGGLVLAGVLRLVLDRARQSGAGQSDA
jgi:DNA-directed RNA polymerase subunit RPC12/RpoP